MVKVRHRNLITDPTLIRDVERTLREHQALAAITPQTLADAAAITPADVEAAARMWERVNSGTDVADILGAEVA